MTSAAARVIVVTGTSTDVGKTIATAAITSCALRDGIDVIVIKPAQTGEAPGAGDLAEIQRLVEPGPGRLTVVDLYRFPSPLAPATAARVDGLPEVDPDVVADAIVDAAAAAPLVIVEGAGGALVRLTAAGATLLTVAERIPLAAERRGIPVPRVETIIVASAGLGTLNHTALTLEALSHRSLPCAGVVIGTWPSDPGLAERLNVADLAGLAGKPLLGVIPAGAGRLVDFGARAGAWLSPGLGGEWNGHDLPAPL